MLLAKKYKYMKGIASKMSEEELSKFKKMNEESTRILLRPLNNKKWEGSAFKHKNIE